MLHDKVGLNEDLVPGNPFFEAIASRLRLQVL